MSASIKKDESGFTLTELTVSIGLIAIISVSLLSAIIYYFAYITRNNVLVDMTTDSQNLLRSTAEELRFGSGVRQTNTIADPNAPVGGWNTGNTNFVIIISVPATDSSKNYIIDPDTGDPYNNELVYFKQGKDLYRRRLANPSAPGNTLKTSCPANLATSTCPADTRLIQYVSSMNFTLYDQDDNNISDPLQARSVMVTLNMSRDTFGQPLTLQNNIRTTLRNNFQ